MVIKAVMTLFAQNFKNSFNVHLIQIKPNTSKELFLNTINNILKDYGYSKKSNNAYR